MPLHVWIGALARHNPGWALLTYERTVLAIE